VSIAGSQPKLRRVVEASSDNNLERVPVPGGRSYRNFRDTVPLDQESDPLDERRGKHVSRPSPDTVPLDQENDPLDECRGKHVSRPSGAEGLARVSLDERRGKHVSRPGESAEGLARVLAQIAHHEINHKYAPPDVDVAQLRKRIGMTQTQFAKRFGFPVATLRHWERGDRKPRGASLALLNVIARNPRIVMDALKPR
jgi:putative transcriptional regulator